MLSATRLQSGPIEVVDVRCSAGPAARPFTELHRGHSVAQVRKGSFGYRVRGEYSDVVAAAVAGQSVAIGRLPLLAELLRDGGLVAPFSAAA